MPPNPYESPREAGCNTHKPGPLFYLLAFALVLVLMVAFLLVMWFCTAGFVSD
jgi:hypothetical protein